ncbi:protein of unknown function (plasmid) [Denitratisoma oestradiolicum]|uniref:Uncharacterized protein n=1 Tax=Denitratisoma oestradiolicum TaxID=311182 RepID=A0A6S6Y6R2_9PROT|nr:protein of unknown function [Denitratisoma oestradiolicum]
MENAYPLPVPACPWMRQRPPPPVSPPREGSRPKARLWPPGRLSYKRRVSHKLHRPSRFSGFPQEASCGKPGATLSLWDIGVSPVEGNAAYGFVENAHWLASAVTGSGCVF